MAKYQITFNTGGGASYEYFETKSTPSIKACRVATDYIDRRKERNNLFRHFKAPRVVTVVEYDPITHKAKKGGNKFKLELSYFQATFNSGRKVRNEWYILKQ